MQFLQDNDDCNDCNNCNSDDHKIMSVLDNYMTITIQQIKNAKYPYEKDNFRLGFVAFVDKQFQKNRITSITKLNFKNKLISEINKLI
jgi:hypothetical protein